MKFNILFCPKLVDTLKKYSPQDFHHDLIAGLTFRIVALPLGMAFAIASGVKSEAGIFTAVIAGFIISAFGGPTGAFIVIHYGVGAKYDLDNLTVNRITPAGLLMKFIRLHFKDMPC